MGAPIKPDPEQQAELERSLLAGASENFADSRCAVGTDSIDGTAAKRVTTSSSTGFRQAQVQRVLGLVDAEFKNFKVRLQSSRALLSC